MAIKLPLEREGKAFWWAASENWSARALYHKPSVLVLDEATSALDNATEKMVMESVQNLGHEITIIMIAHRLSTVRNCDTIYHLDNGYIVSTGTYEELLASDKDFGNMVNYEK